MTLYKTANIIQWLPLRNFPSKLDLSHAIQISIYPHILKLKKSILNLGDSECGTPLLFQDIKTNATITIDVRVKDLGPKCNLARPKCEKFRTQLKNKAPKNPHADFTHYLRGLERIIRRKMDSD